MKPVTRLFAPLYFFPRTSDSMTDAPQPPDGTLIARVLAGETQAFAELVARYQDPLLRLAKSRLGNRDWAEDVVQETLLCAFKSLRSYDSRYSFRTWLWTILLNQCSRHFQKRQRQAEILASAVEVLPATDQQHIRPETSPPDLLLAKEQTEVLAQVLAALPPEQADALRLRFFGELKFQEIADVQGCSLTTAKNRVRFGLLRMAGRLEPTDATLATCSPTINEAQR
jgi:RNA polymerase sigma-70 factor (ECF subfamily)